MHKSLDKFEPYVRDGYIRKVISPCKKLVLFNYTDKTTYENKWDEITLKARGTVYEISTGRIIARAFDKFFNFSQLSPEKQKEVLNAKSFETFEKLDGSLGIVYYYDGEWRVNTRGSFTSDQAVKGREFLSKFGDLDKKLHKEATYLVEIIYPENRIIVDYYDLEGLCLLHAEFLDNPDMLFDVPFAKARSIKFNSIQELQEHLETLDHTEEGYVVLLNTGERVKFKSAEYLKVARIMNHLSPLSLWKAMENGKVKVDYLEHLPEEFREEVDELTKKLEKQYLEKGMRLSIEFKAHFLSTQITRKEIAQISKEKDLNLSAMFAILDGKKEVLDRLIMKELRPQNNKME